MLLYLARPASGKLDGGPMLQLVGNQGYGELPDALKSIPFGKGRIG